MRAWADRGGILLRFAKAVLRLGRASSIMNHEGGDDDRVTY